jgi:anti-sigma-K factor RskA
MNCKRAGELMPLYATGDLEATRAREVAAHLATCEDCRALAAEFAESRSLLAEACEPPEFGAEFYAGIRSAVLDEIKRDRPTPSTPSLFATLFGRRLVYAASFAVALIVLALAFQLARRNVRESNQPIAARGNEQPRFVRPNDVAPSPPRRQDQAATPPQNLLANVSRHARSSRPATSTRRDANERVTSTYDKGTQSESIAGTSVARATTAFETVPTTTESTRASVESAPEVSRIEIQTADPNIRIIWLTPQKSEAPNPERDKHENGDRK